MMDYVPGNSIHCMDAGVPRNITFFTLRSVCMPTIQILSILSNDRETSLELDTHTDTCASGHDALMFLDHEQPIKILGYDPALGNKEYQTVASALAYDHPQTGQTYYFVIYQGIEDPKLDHSPVSLYQYRVNDMTINDVPKILTPNPTIETHPICVPNPYDKPGTLISPLVLDSMTSYLPMKKPTMNEWHSGVYPRVNLTSEDLTFDPSNPSYTEQEDSITDFRGDSVVNDPAAREYTQLVINSLSSLAVDK